jgi:hypothetical protein
MSFYPAYVKVVRTTNSNYYNVDIDWTTERFITEMNAWVLRDFNLQNAEYVYAFYYDNNVRTGNISSEDAPAIVSSNYATLRMLYNISNLTFYIRPLVNQPSNNTVNNIVNIAAPNPNVINTNILCITCDTNQRNIVFGPCNHLCICSSCNINIVSHCPICRSRIINRTQIFIP